MIAWKKFSSQYSGYDPEECNTKWNSFSSNHSGDTLKMASLVYWAKSDDINKYTQIMRETLAGKLNDTIFSKYACPEAHDKVNKVIYEYYKDQFISVNIQSAYLHLSTEELLNKYFCKLKMELCFLFLTNQIYPKE